MPTPIPRAGNTPVPSQPTPDQPEAGVGGTDLRWQAPKNVPFDTKHPNQRKHYSEMDKKLSDAGNLLINVPFGRESVKTATAMFHRLDHLKATMNKGRGMNIHQPICSDPTEHSNNRYSFNVRSVRHFLDLTVGVVPADLFRFAYLGQKFDKPLLDMTLGPNDDRVDLEGAQVRTDPSQVGNFISKSEFKRRSDAMHGAAVRDHLLQHKIKMADMGLDPNQQKELDEDVETLDLGYINFATYVKLCKQFLRPEYEPVVEYANNVGSTAFLNDIPIMEEMGSAENFPLTNIGLGKSAPAQDIPLNHVFGQLGHVEGFEAAKKAFFAGNVRKGADGKVIKDLLFLNLATGTAEQFYDKDTGEMTPDFTAALKTVDEYSKEVREADAADSGYGSQEPRKIVILSAKPLKASAKPGSESAPMPSMEVFNLPTPDAAEAADLIIPDFLISQDKKAKYQNQPFEIKDANGQLSPAAKGIVNKMARFAAGLSYSELHQFLANAVANCTRAGVVDFDKVLNFMRGNYTENLAKSMGDASGAQVKEQFKVCDPDQDLPDGMSHPDQVMEFLAQYSTTMPIMDLLDNSQATKASLDNLMASLNPPISPEKFGYQATRTPTTPPDQKVWAEVSMEDLPSIKKKIQAEIRERRGNFLLFSGPGGMGKSTTAMFLAHMLDYGFMMWNMCRSKNMFVGNTEKNIEASFNFVAKLKDHVILLDEVDECLAPKGGGNDGGTSASVLGTFKKMMTSEIIPRCKENNLIIISTTNKYKDFEEQSDAGAILRRLGRDGHVALDYLRDRNSIQNLANNVVDRHRSDPAFPRLQQCKQAFADALFSEASVPKERGGRGAYSNDEIDRLFSKWVGVNRSYILSKFGEQFLYKPETLVWLVQNSQRADKDGSLNCPTIPESIITGAHPKNKAPDALEAPGYKPFGVPKTPGVVPQQQAVPAVPNSNQTDINLPGAKEEAETLLLPPAEARAKKSIKVSEKTASKPSIKLMSIADSLSDQMVGLKYVKSLPDMTGMLFRYQSPKILSFWMQDTYLPLDIAFIDADGMITKTSSMIPMSTRPVRSDKPCVMALEVAAGTLKSVGAIVGKKVIVDTDKKTVHFE